jgi:transcriptional regulator with XRE-family HTH domain
MGSPSWAEYVQQIKDHMRQADVSAKTDIHQATISRWLNGGKPGSAEQVAEFARAYPDLTTVLEAFVAAGFLTAEEAGLDPKNPKPKLDAERPLEDMPTPDSAVS